MNLDITGLSSDLTLCALFAHMAHPGDIEARERYGAYLVSQLHFATDLAISNETLGWLIEAAKVGVGNDFDKAAAGGCMAGDVLLARLEMQGGEVPNAGLDKACHVVSEYYGGFHNSEGKKISSGFFSGEGKSFKASRETVLDNWRKYGSAAHLWAAYLILLRKAEANGTRNDPSKWLDGHKLASIAMALKTVASQIETPNNASSVLPTDALEIAGTLPIWIQAPVLTEDFFVALNSFVSRKKISE